MITRRIFTFPIATLYTEGDLILTTAESPEEKTVIDARLDDGHVAATRALLSELNPDDDTTHLIRGLLGTMTQAQRDALKKVNKFKARARKSARLAYRGQSVLLHETFLIGNDGPADIGTMLRNADKLLASCSHPDHAAALKKQGWIAKDNTDFATAIRTAKEAFKDNLDKKADSKDETNDTTQQANELYLGLLAIQNAANNEYDEDAPANRGIRAKYRLGLFPPTAPESKGPSTDPTTPPVS
jgi:hypothetical protein